MTLVVSKVQLNSQYVLKGAYRDSQIGYPTKKLNC